MTLTAQNNLAYCPKIFCPDFRQKIVPNRDTSVLILDTSITELFGNGTKVVTPKSEHIRFLDIHLLYIDKFYVFSAEK